MFVLSFVVVAFGTAGKKEDTMKNKHNEIIDVIADAARQGKAGRGPCQAVRTSYNGAEPMHPSAYALLASSRVVKRKKGDTQRGNVVSNRTVAV